MEDSPVGNYRETAMPAAVLKKSLRVDGQPRDVEYRVQVTKWSFTSPVACMNA